MAGLFSRQTDNHEDRLSDLGDPSREGPSGNGTVTYPEYDARGHALRRVDGDFDLKFAYDRAERLFEVKETGGSQRVMKSFTYGDHLPAGTPSNGKIETATRRNYPPIGGSPFEVIVTETYTYAGKGVACPSARPSSTTTGSTSSPTPSPGPMTIRVTRPVSATPNVSYGGDENIAAMEAEIKAGGDPFFPATARYVTSVDFANDARIVVRRSATPEVKLHELGHADQRARDPAQHLQDTHPEATEGLPRGDRPAERYADAYAARAMERQRRHRALERHNDFLAFGSQYTFRLFP